MIREITESKYLTCKICGNDFAFTIGEQAFYQDRGLAEPRRCPACRRAKREEMRNEHTKN